MASPCEAEPADMPAGSRHGHPERAARMMALDACRRCRTTARAAVPLRASFSEHPIQPPNKRMCWSAAGTGGKAEIVGHFLLPNSADNGGTNATPLWLAGHRLIPRKSRHWASPVRWANCHGLISLQAYCNGHFSKIPPHLIFLLKDPVSEALWRTGKGG